MISRRIPWIRMSRPLRMFLFMGPAGPTYYCGRHYRQYTCGRGDPGDLGPKWIRAYLSPLIKAEKPAHVLPYCLFFFFFF